MVNDVVVRPETEINLDMVPKKLIKIHEEFGLGIGNTYKYMIKEIEILEILVRVKVID